MIKLIKYIHENYHLYRDIKTDIIDRNNDKLYIV